MFQSDREKDKTYSIGFDASLTSFGVYCYPINHNEWYGFSVSSTARDGSDTSRVITLSREVIFSLLQLPYPIAIVGFEDYGPINRTSGKIAQRAEMCGILKAFALIELRVPVVTVPPNALKGFATGKGNASKEQMLNSANSHGYYPDTHDEADAYFVARLAKRVHEGVRIGASYVLTNPVT